MRVPHALGGAFFAAAWVGACNGTIASGNPGGDGGGSDTGTPGDATAVRADAFINATVGAGSLSGNGSAVCLYASPQIFVIIGTPNGPKPTTVGDGNTQGGAAVHVMCTVSPTGSGFHVQAIATVEGLTGGTLSLSGDVNSSGGQGVIGTFTGQMGSTFTQSGCTVAYTGTDVTPIMPAVAPGRIWGHLSCPFAERTDERVPNPNGGAMIYRTCDAEADFLFENCGP